MTDPDQILKLVFSRFAWLVILVYACALPVFGWGFIQALETNNNNIRQWLPAEYEATKTYREFRSRFGSGEFAVVTWKGCTLDDPRLAEFAKRLLQDKGDTGGRARLFRSVRTGPELLDQLTGPPSDLDREIASERLEGIVIGQDHQQTCALVTFSEYGNRHRIRAVEAMRKTATEEVGIKPDNLYLAGEPVVNAAIDSASQQAVGTLPLWSAAIALIVAVLGLRNLRLALFVFGTALYCGAMALSFVYFTGGNLNLVLVVMPVLIFVLSLSASVHLIHYFRDSRAETAARDAPVETLRRGVTPVGLSAATTAAGLGSLWVSNIRPVQDFGLYSALGIFASLAVLFILLPALLSVFPQKLEPWESSALRGTLSLGAARTGKRAQDWILLRRNWIAATGLLLLAAGGAGVSTLDSSVHPRRFFPARSELLEDIQWVAEHIGPQAPLELVVRFDEQEASRSTLEQLELVRDIQESVEKMDIVSATLSAATFAPRLPNGSRDAPAEGSSRGGSAAGSRQENATGLAALEDVPVIGNLQLERRVLNQNLKEARPKFEENNLLAPQEQASHWRISVRVGNGRLAYDRVLEDIRQRVESFLEQQPSQRTAGVEVTYTGMVPLFFLAQRQLLKGLFRSFLLAFVLIAILMILLLRTLPGGLLAMVPNIFPATLAFGAMGYLRWPVDIGSMLTASAAIGIAVDDTVHFVTWFRRGIDQGHDRHESIRYAYRQCGPAMVQTSAIIGLAMLVYATSWFVPISQFGLLIAVMLGLTLLGDLVLLPALLAGPAGRWLE